jgi:hypothetical protein
LITVALTTYKELPAASSLKQLATGRAGPDLPTPRCSELACARFLNRPSTYLRTFRRWALVSALIRATRVFRKRVGLVIAILVLEPVVDCTPSFLII